MKKKFFIGLFIISAIGLFIFAHIVLKNNDAAYQPQQNLNAPIEIPNENVISYEEANALDKPIVVMFYVDWCSYCRKFMPVFGQLAKEYKNDYTFAVVNCDIPQNIKLINEFHIMGFPSLFVVDNELNHRFSMNMASTTDKAIMKEELNNFLSFRKSIINK